MRKSRIPTIWATIALFLALIAPANATAGGVPTFVVMIPISWILFFVLLPIKATVLARFLKRKWSHALGIALPASALSTLIGIPAVSMASAILGTSSSVFPYPLNWIFSNLTYIPIEGEIGPAWAETASVVLLLIFACITSIWIETHSSGKRLSDLEKPLAQKWAWITNICSYAVLIIALIVFGN